MYYAGLLEVEGLFLTEQLTLSWRVGQIMPTTVLSTLRQPWYVCLICEICLSINFKNNMMLVPVACFAELV